MAITSLKPAFCQGFTDRRTSGDKIGNYMFAIKKKIRKFQAQDIPLWLAITGSALISEIAALQAAAPLIPNLPLLDMPARAEFQP